MSRKEKWGAVSALTAGVATIILCGVVTMNVTGALDIMSTRQTCEVVEETETVTIKECRRVPDVTATFGLGMLFLGMLPGVIVTSAIAKLTQERKVKTK